MFAHDHTIFNFKTAPKQIIEQYKKCEPLPNFDILYKFDPDKKSVEKYSNPKGIYELWIQSNTADYEKKMQKRQERRRKRLERKKQIMQSANETSSENKSIAGFWTKKQVVAPEVELFRNRFSIHGELRFLKTEKERDRRILDESQTGTKKQAEHIEVKESVNESKIGENESEEKPMLSVKEKEESFETQNDTVITKTEYSIPPPPLLKEDSPEIKNKIPTHSNEEQKIKEDLKEQPISVDSNEIITDQIPPPPDFGRFIGKTNVKVAPSKTDVIPPPPPMKKELFASNASKVEKKPDILSEIRKGVELKKVEEPKKELISSRADFLKQIQQVCL